MTDEQPPPAPPDVNGHDEQAAQKAAQSSRDQAVRDFNEASVFFAETMARVQKHREIHGKKPVDNRAVETDVALLEVQLGAVIACLVHILPDKGEALFNTMARQLALRATAKAETIGARRIVRPD